MPRFSLTRRLHRVRQYFVQRVLHADDPPCRLALGVAIGTFVTFLPLVGIQMALVVLFASLLRANKAVGLPIVWITNPATMVPIFYVCYTIGRLMLGQDGISWHWWVEVQTPPPGWWAATCFYYTRLLQIAWPLWAGSFVVATTTATLAYGVTYGAVSRYRVWRSGRDA